MHRNRFLFNIISLMVVAPTLGVPISKWHHHAPAGHSGSCGNHDQNDRDEDTLPGDDSCALCAIAQAPVADLSVSADIADIAPTPGRLTLSRSLVVVHVFLPYGARSPPLFAA
jgi:hypothetical protein